MLKGIRTLDDVAVRDKTVICRVDMNEPIDSETGRLQDNTRILGCAPTVRQLSDQGARVVVLTHQGNELDYGNYHGTAPHGEELSRILGREICFIEDVCGPAAIDAIQALKAGEILLLDNVRYLVEEGTLFERAAHLSPEKLSDTLIVRKLAPLADLFVCDAFAAAHRSQPSICGFPQRLPSAMGRLFERELQVMEKLMNSPVRPCTLLLGGARVGESFQMMRAVLTGGIADQVLTGGLVGLVLLWADGYDIGAETRGFIEGLDLGALVKTGEELLEEFPGKIVTPTDFGFVKNGARREAMLHALPGSALVTDIGSGTAELFRKLILEAGTVFAYGPMGVYEEPLSELGTRKVWDAIGETGAYTIVGGNNSIHATRKYGKETLVNHISTGSRTLIRLLSGEPLPAMEALQRGSEISF